MHSGATGDQWRLGRRPGLDGLRGVAILLVLLGHLAVGGPNQNAGSMGVTLFFVLSGFLITALLLEERARSRRVSFGGFYARRARRLIPALVPMVAAVTIVELHYGWSPWAGLIGAATYSANWVAISGHPLLMLEHTWSLAIEEQFYLIWPIVLVVALRRRVSLIQLSRWCLALVALSAALRWWLATHGAAGVAYHSTFTRADALLLGCAVALLLHAGVKLSLPPAARAPLFAALVVIALWPGGKFGHDVVAPTAGLLGGACVLYALTGGPVLASSVLRYFGTRSYGIYLWNAPFLTVLGTAGHATPGPTRLLLTVLGVAAAEVSWRVIEKPILSRRSGGSSVHGDASRREGTRVVGDLVHDAGVELPAARGADSE